MYMGTLYPITATASISMRSLGSMRAETSTIEDAGYGSSKYLLLTSWISS